METELITSVDDLSAPVLDGWDRLAVRMSMPYSTPAWMLSFWREFHEPTGAAEPRVVVVRDDEEIVGIGPFYAGARRPLGLREWWVLGAGIGQRTGPLAAPGREQEVAQAMAGRLARERPTALRLPASDSGQPWGRWLGNAWPGRWQPHHVAHAEPALTITVGADGDYQAWLGRQSRSLRYEITRCTRRVNALGATIRRIEDPDEVPRALRSLVALQHARFTEKGRTSSITPDAERAVARGTAHLMADGQRARVWVVETPDGPVGVQVHLVSGVRMCFYNGGYSPDWAKESLGTVLLAAALRDAHELGVHTLDFGGGDQPYKRRFADAEAPLEWASVLPRGIHYPVERARLMPADARRAAKQLASRLPEPYRRQLMVLKRFAR